MEKTYIIAEIGVNHNGSVDIARELIDVSLSVGADAAKFQHFSPEALVTETAEKAAYQKANDDSATQAEMLRQLALTDDEMAAVRKYCGDVGIDFLCTPFDLDAVDLLATLKVSAIKIGSGDLTYDRLLAKAAGLGLPMIVSSGMADLDEIGHALETIADARPSAGVSTPAFPPLTLLHCTSAYPTPVEAVNLAAMSLMAETFGVPVGYSDHTTSTLVPALAVAAGASMIEKHITLDKSAEGPDHRASLNPAEFRSMVEQIRFADRMLGVREKRPQSVEIDTRRVARRSLHYARPVARGDVLAADDLVALRPGTGLPPNEETRWIGSTLKQDRDAGETVRREDFED